MATVNGVYQIFGWPFAEAIYNQTGSFAADSLQKQRGMNRRTSVDCGPGRMPGRRISAARMDFWPVHGDGVC
jgi:hypothetical protein